MSTAAFQFTARQSSLVPQALLRNPLAKHQLLIRTFSLFVLATETTVTQQVSSRDKYLIPARGHKEVRSLTGHIMVTTRYSNQQGSDTNGDKILAGSNHPTTSGTYRRHCCVCGVCFPHTNRSGLNHTQNCTRLPIPYVVCWTGKHIKSEKHLQSF